MRLAGGRFQLLASCVTTISGRRHPRKRVIQYSRGACDQSRGRGVLGPPLSRRTTVVCVGPLAGPWAISPPEPFRLARQFDRLDLLELDGALGHEIVEIAVGGAGDFRTIEIDLERAAMILVGPGRGIADPFHAGWHPILLLIKTLRD